MRNVRINLNLNSLPRECGKCKGEKVIVRTPGRVQVYCPNCDKV